MKGSGSLFPRAQTVGRSLAVRRGPGKAVCQVLGRSSGLQEKENLHPARGWKRGSCFFLAFSAASLSCPKAHLGVM